jgi:hypothetical protein
VLFFVVAQRRLLPKFVLTRPDDPASSFTTVQQSNAVLSFNNVTTTCNNTAVEARTRGKTSMYSPFWDRQDWQYCKEKNVVLGSKAGRPRKMPYTITENDFRRFHNKTCNTPDEIMLSIKYGQRKWDDPKHENLTNTEREQHPSYFVPAHCDVPPVIHHYACSILSEYSHVIVIGDSLTRHFHQALYVVLRNDLALGGVVSSAPFMHENCRCDGQFSEYKQCRTNDGTFQHMTDPQLQLGICSLIPSDFEMHFLPQRWDTTTWEKYTDFDLPSNMCNDKSSRGVLFYFHAGVHYDFNSSVVIKDIVEPVLNDPKLHECGPNKVTVIWQSGDARTRNQKLEKAYPTQTRDRSRQYNTEMARYFATECNRTVHVLDTWNMTKDAQTSDGVHYLTDVNLQKAYAFLNLARLTQEQENMQ